MRKIAMDTSHIRLCCCALFPLLLVFQMLVTGSTDNTIQLMQEHFDKQSLPGIVARHDWRDFGYNRNLCMEVSCRRVPDYSTVPQAPLCKSLVNACCSCITQQRSHTCGGNMLLHMYSWLHESYFAAAETC
jgi:hypothetical protein